MTVANLVIDRLRSLEFVVREDDVRLFGEQIPFVRAIAFDPQARQLAVVAEDGGEEAADWEEVCKGEWRDLLFAMSGLRRQLSGSRPPALCQPVLIAVVPSAVGAHLRGLVEEVVAEYALFTRIDLNILDAGVETPAAVDRGMASLLPLTREAIKKGVTVATQDVEQFWVELEAAVAEVGESSVTKFDRKIVGSAVADLIGALRADLQQPGVTAAARMPEPIFDFTLRDFRSFAEGEVKLGPTTIIHGSNGSGKTSICEAMEILWSGRTRRIPEGVKTAEYEKHLNFEGRQFHLRTADDLLAAEAIADESGAILGRAVLPQERLTEMADGTPARRFRAFLESSGLELPEFERRLKDEQRRALDRLNEAYAEIGVERVGAVTHGGSKPLDEALKAGFADRMPSSDRISAAAAGLEEEAAGAYKADMGSLAADLGQAQRRLLDLDAALAEFAANRRRARSPSVELEEVGLELRKIVQRLRGAAQPLSLLLRYLQTMADASIPARVEDRPAAMPAPISPALRARWLTQARSLEAEITSLDQLAVGVEDPAWRRRIDAYLDALREAAARSSRTELERLVEPPSDRSAQRIPNRAESPSPKMLEDAGFSEAPPPSARIIESILALQFEIGRQADQVEAIAEGVESHPAAAFAANAQRVESALCRFELRRELTKPNGALTKAREALVGRLLDQRLTPVVRELVDALVRFEWYFKPLEVEVRGRELRFHGLGSGDPKLDVRMLLNAAERTIVGIAWFLGLHLTQEKGDRKVLILDDPASGFDETNKAAFVSTLSVLLDLLQPAQFLLTTHDEALVASLEIELGPVSEGGDPVSLLRCRRTEAGTSEILPDQSQAGQLPDLEADLEALHFDLTGPSPAKTE